MYVIKKHNDTVTNADYVGRRTTINVRKWKTFAKSQLCGKQLAVNPNWNHIITSLSCIVYFELLCNLQTVVRKSVSIFSVCLLFVRYSTWKMRLYFSPKPFLVHVKWFVQHIQFSFMHNVYINFAEKLI